MEVSQRMSGYERLSKSRGDEFNDRGSVFDPLMMQPFALFWTSGADKTVFVKSWGI